jgi:hypothetical protein
MTKAPLELRAPPPGSPRGASAPRASVVAVGRIALAAIALAGAASCAHPDPPPEGVHGVVRLRRAYRGVAGERVEESCRVAGQQVFQRMDLVEALSVPLADAFVVPPGPTRLEFTATFVHRGSYSDAVDATCTSAIDFAPADGGSYLVDFTYLVTGACSLTCVERVAGGHGVLEERPCATR